MPPNEDNTTIQQMRTELDKYKDDIRNITKKLDDSETARNELASKIKDAERSQMAEIDRVKAERDDLKSKHDELTVKVGEVETLKTVVTDLNTYVSSLYEQKLTTVPETQREAIKKLTFHENPKVALEKLESALLVINPIDPSRRSGSVTNPPNPAPGVNPTTPEAIDPKTIGWGTALKSRADIIAQKKNLGQ